MASDLQILEERLAQMLPSIINDSALGPFISMSRMLDVVVRKNAFRGCRYDNSALFPEELIAHFRQSGQTVDNSHRITLTLGNPSSLSLQILAEAPGGNTLVRYRLVYTDGTLSAESDIGYGSHSLTNDGFDDLIATFERHRPSLTRSLDQLSLDISRRRSERQLFRQALPIFVGEIVPPYGYPYQLDLSSRLNPDGAVLHIRPDKTCLISFLLSTDDFEQQLAAIGHCIASVDRNTIIITSRELEIHRLEVRELRDMLSPRDRDEVTYSHFVRLAKEYLKDIVGQRCFRICYLTGLSAELYVALTDGLWLRTTIRSATYLNDIDLILSQRTSLMRLMTTHHLRFVMNYSG